MNIDKWFPSKYLKAVDLDTEESVFTITSVAEESIRDVQSGKDKDQPVIYFEEIQKGLILNKTNTDSIAALYGRDPDAWVGKRLTLYVQHGLQAFNQTWDVIRVRSSVPPTPQEKEEGGVPI